MPNRPRTHQLAELAVQNLHARFEAQGWTVEELKRDYGEDLLVRLFQNESATPYSFYVQAKSTDQIKSYSRKKSDSYAYPVTTEHLRHWNRFKEPVFLTLYDSSSDQTFWVCVQIAAERISKLAYKRKTVRIPIPSSNVLDHDGILRIRGITRLRFEQTDRQRRAGEFLVQLQTTHPAHKIRSYEPINEYIEIDTDSGRELFFLGSFGERMEEYVRRSGLEPSEFLYEAAKAYLRRPITSDSKIKSRHLLEEIERNKERQAGGRSLLD